MLTSKNNMLNNIYRQLLKWYYHFRSWRYISVVSTSCFCCTQVAEDLVVFHLLFFKERMNYVYQSTHYMSCFFRINVRSGQRHWTPNVVAFTKQWRSWGMCSVPFMNQRAPRRLLRNLFQVLLSPSFKCCTQVEISIWVTVIQHPKF